MPRIALSPKAIGSLRGVGVGSGLACWRIFFLACVEASRGAGRVLNLIMVRTGLGYGGFLGKRIA